MNVDAGGDSIVVWCWADGAAQSSCVHECVLYGIQIVEYKCTCGRMFYTAAQSDAWSRILWYTRVFGELIHRFGSLTV